MLRISDQAFRDEFGDYYVAGYQIGADAGACLTIAHLDESEQETTRITGAVKVLWVSKSVTKATSTSSNLSSDYLSFRSYDSLQQRNDEAHGCDIGRIQQVSSECMERIEGLQMAIARRLDDLGCSETGAFDASACNQLCRSGVVVQLIMLPYCKLFEYVTLSIAKQSSA